MWKKKEKIESNSSTELENEFFFFRKLQWSRKNRPELSVVGTRLGENLAKYSKTGVQGFFATNQAWIAKFLLKLKIAKDAYLLENTLTKEFSYIRKPTGWIAKAPQ